MFYHYLGRNNINPSSIKYITRANWPNLKRLTINTLSNSELISIESSGARSLVKSKWPKLQFLSLCNKFPNIQVQQNRAELAFRF